MSELTDITLPPDQSEGSVAKVLRWLARPGDAIEVNAPLVEIETDKVTVEVAAPASGELADILLSEGADAAPGAILGRLRCGTKSRQAAAADKTPQALQAPTSAIVPPGDADGIATGGVGSRRGLLSPAVRRLLNERGLEPSAIRGSGRDGRISKTDVDQHLATMPTVSAPTGATERVADRPTPLGDAASGRLPHSAMRRRIAEHMTRSLATAPHVTAVFEADLSAVMAHRAAHVAAFAARGTKLTLTAYFVAASARALQAVPQVNSTFHEDALELHTHCNIGVGTALGDAGLIVPVVHEAETLDLFGIASALTTLTGAARAGRLPPESVRGGTFTISNHGVSGSLIAAPVVINQPQVAILGVGAIEKRVVVREIDGRDALLIRPMCYVTLTIDHRALDGYQSDRFLAHLVKTLHGWPAEADLPQWGPGN